ncbi:MAG: M14 family zinc carboxypeptidase [Actinomycetota bacterium]
MRIPRPVRLVALFSFVAVLATSAPAPGAPSPGGRERLQMYEAVIERGDIQELRRQGVHFVDADTVRRGIEVTTVLTPTHAARLRAQGFRLRLARDSQGRTAQQRAAAQAENGFTVWRSWDEPGGIRDELYQVAADNPDLVKLEVLGHSIHGREIIGLKVTEDANTVPDGTRPAVLYSSLQHAREWISVEVNRRLLHWFIDRYRAGRTQLLEDNELWFIVVANPDGYQYTFEVDRLWRKNLRDNDGDGEITNADGVDPNRNFPEHWNYDEQGSSGQFSSETYRGTAPMSEPETQAMVGLMEDVPFAFQVNYHSFGQLLLYPQGWQVQTPSADDPIYVAMTGTDLRPAVKRFDPGVGAELYITNGETTDYAHATHGILAWTPELSEGAPGAGFVFPDDEALVEREFRRILPFSRDAARSAADPDDPTSHLGTQTEPFYLDVSTIDPEKAHNPMSDFTFRASFGDPQPVQVLAKRSLGEVTLNYSVNGGPAQTAPTAEWEDADRFGTDYDVYYHIVRGEVTGTEPGDEVEVWFTGGGEQSDSFTYAVAEESDAPVVIVAAEDYTGITNSPPYQSSSQPNYLSYFQDALAANGIDYEVYDVDGHGRTAPDHLGVLGHFDAAIWYTANDLITRDPGMRPGTASRLANDMVLEFRSYLNEGGNVLYNGQWAGLQYAFGYEFDPEDNDPCNPDATGDRCDPLSDDFLQYYLGAFLYQDEAGTAEDGSILDVVGTQEPYEGTSWGFNGPDSGDNQIHSAGFLTTSSILDPQEYPQFDSHAPAEWDIGGGSQFEPHSGDFYMYSNRADISFKRLSRTIDLTGATTADLSFFFSYDTEPEWDFVFVEAHTVGQDDWTTLPDVNGHTSQSTGQSCPAGWHELHPWLERYQGSDCSGTGTGEWWANSGRSQGWEEWKVDLSQYAGSEVEVAISYASDWAIQGLGAFVDDITVSTGEGSTSFEEDSDPMDGWTVPGSPEGSDPNPNDWERTMSVGFEEGAVVAMDPPDAAFRTLYFGFGFEGITDETKRAEVMGRSIEWLLGG